MSLDRIQEPPDKGVVLLLGPPGAGKSTFCYQVVVNSIAADRPVIFVTSERSPSDIIGLLNECGMGVPMALNFVDAFTETVGLTTIERSDTIRANCTDLNSLSIAITKLQEILGRKGIFLVIDSLTSPYLFTGTEVVKFIRLFLSKFAAEGNSVLALMDEGCGKEEDLVAMMSVTDGILRMEIKENSRIINVVKHPVLEPTIIKFLKTESTSMPLRTIDAFMTGYHKAAKKRYQTSLRSEVGDFVNVFWRSFTFWSGMLWDPKRFPTMLYNLNKEGTYQMANLFMTKLPWHIRLLYRFMPKGAFHSTRFIEKRIFPIISKPFQEIGEGVMEYLTDISKTDEHYIRIYEGALCWGLENIGASLCYDEVAYLTGMLKFFDKEGRDWNAMEITCVGKGSAYCEIKVVPGKLDELEGYLLDMDSAKIERITERLMEHVTDFILYGKSLGERPRLGNVMHIHNLVPITALYSERYRMAIRMAGAMTGKRLGDHLTNARVVEDEVIRRVIDFMEYCKVAKITLGETIRMEENCESFGLETGQLSCFFTTGFLNGLFSAVKNKHVREIKCVAAGDPYCEWEII